MILDIPEKPMYATLPLNTYSAEIELKIQK